MAFLKDLVLKVQSMGSDKAEIKKNICQILTDARVRRKKHFLNSVPFKNEVN